MGYGNKEKLSGKLQVVKQNPLNNAKFETSVMDYKVLMTGLSKIHPGDSVLKLIKFRVEEFCSLIGYDREKFTGMYPYLKRSCERLLTKVVKVDTGDGWKMFNWLDYIEYIESKAEIHLQFHRFLEPFLIFWRENEGYTKYLLENIIQMDSKYAIRVYELLKQYESIGERTIPINELRELLGVDKGTYEKITHLRQKVIEPAYKEVNQKSDIVFEFELIKEGRKVVAIKFSIQSKTSPDYTSLDALPKKQLAKLLQLEIKNRYVIEFEIDTLENYHRKVNLELLKKIKSGEFKDTNVRSPFAFFKWQLDEISSMYDLKVIPDF